MKPVRKIPKLLLQCWRLLPTGPNPDGRFEINKKHGALLPLFLSAPFSRTLYSTQIWWHYIRKSSVDKTSLGAPREKSVYPSLLHGLLYIYINTRTHTKQRYDDGLRRELVVAVALEAAAAAATEVVVVTGWKSILTARREHEKERERQSESQRGGIICTNTWWHSVGISFHLVA